MPRRSAGPAAIWPSPVPAGAATSQTRWPSFEWSVHRPRLAVGSQVKLLHLVEMERPRADASKHGDLIARLIDRAIAFESPRQRHRRALGRIPRDQMRFRIRAEAIELRLRFRACQLQ